MYLTTNIINTFMKSYFIFSDSEVQTFNVQQFCGRFCCYFTFNFIQP
jgi:hypothetical protein